MEDENINRRNEALARFRESLSLPMSERYFTEDELIDFFDFAGDVNDDYLRLEVLMCAARFYPDSEELQQRKAIFYSQYSDETRAKSVEDNPEATGMIWDILRARTAPLDDTGSKQAILQSIMDSYDSWNDEEAIQFMGLAYDLDEYNWLKANFELLRKKVTFINGLLYEMSVIADRNQDMEFAIAILEELTELEPFNLYYWIMLAKEYAMNDEPQKALNAIEYALAIDPDDPQSLYIKAKLMLDDGKNLPQVTELLRKVIEKAPTATEAARLLASILSESGNTDEAYNVLQTQLDNNPDDATNLIPEMIMYKPAMTSQLLDRLYVNEGETSRLLWMSWANQLSANGQSELAKDVVDAYQRNSGEKIYSLLPIETMFKQCKFADTLMALSEYLDSDETTDVDFPMMVYMHLLSMLKLGELDKAQSFCEFFESNMSARGGMTISQKLELAGVVQIVKDVRSKLLQSHDIDDWTHYDPLNIW